MRSLLIENGFKSIKAYGLKKTSIAEVAARSGINETCVVCLGLGFFCYFFHFRSSFFGSCLLGFSFLNAFLNRDENLEGHDLFGILTEAGYTPEQARAVCAFQ